MNFPVRGRTTSVSVCFSGGSPERLRRGSLGVGRELPPELNCTSCTEQLARHSTPRGSLTDPPKSKDSPQDGTRCITARADGSAG